MKKRAGPALEKGDESCNDNNQEKKRNKQGGRILFLFRIARAIS